MLFRITSVSVPVVLSSKTPSLLITFTSDRTVVFNLSSIEGTLSVIISILSTFLYTSTSLKVAFNTFVLGKGIVI